MCVCFLPLNFHFQCLVNVYYNLFCVNSVIGSKFQQGARKKAHFARFTPFCYLRKYEETFLNLLLFFYINIIHKNAYILLLDYLTHQT